MHDADFIAHFQGLGKYTSEDVLAARKWCAKIFRIPLSKVVYGLSFDEIKKAIHCFGGFDLDLEYLDGEVDRLCKEYNIARPKQNFTNINELILFYLDTKKAQNHQLQPQS